MSVVEPGNGMIRLGPASTTGGSLRVTVIVTSSKLVFSRSVAVSRRTYVPKSEKATLVAAESGGEKVTAPGPEIFVQTTLRILLGSPSSVTIPIRFAPAGGGMFRSGAGEKVTCSKWFVSKSFVLMNCPSE